MEPFRKSSHSNPDGNCMEVGGDFRKASASHNAGSCVEVASGVRVQDTKQSHLGDARDVLAFTSGQWRAFVTVVKSA